MNLIRGANPGDARFLVPLVAISSGGVWPALWRVFADDGESVEDSGAQYLANSSNDLSVRNTVIAEMNGHRVGAMISYQEGNRPSENDDVSSSLPPQLNKALQPYRELTDPDSLFISELCLLAESRGKGIGSHLIDHAKKTAIDRNLPRVTLRVFSSNTGAVRLYKRSGFDVTGERRIVSHPDINISGSVLLMSCDVC